MLRIFLFRQQTSQSEGGQGGGARGGGIGGSEGRDALAMASLPVGQQGSGVHGGTRVGALWHSTYEHSPTTPLAQWQESEWQGSEWQGSGKRGKLGAMHQDEDFSVGLHLVHLCVTLSLLLLRVTLFPLVLSILCHTVTSPDPQDEGLIDDCFYYLQK